MAVRNSSQTFDEFCSRVAAEFGEPAVDVIRGMREQGQSWAVIAGALECNEGTLSKQWAWRGGWADQRRLYRNHWQDSDATLEARAKALGFADLRQMMTDYYMRGLTRQDAARDLECSPNSFHTALKGGLDLPPRPSTPAQTAARRRNVARLNAKRWGASSTPGTTD